MSGRRSTVITRPTPPTRRRFPRCSFRTNLWARTTSSLPRYSSSYSPTLRSARRLGLVPAGTPAFIRLPDGRILGVPQPATGAQSASGGAGGGQPAGATGAGR